MKPVTQKEMARRVGVNKSVITKYKALGVDVTDEDAVRRHKAENKRGGQPNESYGDLRAEKLRLTKAQADRAELEVRRLRRELVAVEEVRADLLRIGSTVKALILRLESDLPPTLHGLEPAEMQLRIRESVDKILSQLSEMASYMHGA